MALRFTAAHAPHRAVFLDKDGTLVPNIPYNVDPGQIAFLPGAAPALQTLQAAGYVLIVVSNQSGVARGYFDEAALRPVRQRLEALFVEARVLLTGFYYCPHHPDGRIPRYAVACDCRKPQPGMLVRAAQEHALDLRHSWLIGDILDDVEAGRRAGCSTILLNNGGETEWRCGPQRRPERVAGDLLEAARYIAGAGAIQ
jgi:D-glycero-D-manno-heptose 1,7-bisphosphate phosphatase